MAVAAVVVLALLVLIAPRLRGLRYLHFWLSGEEVTTSVTDWTFTDEFLNVQIETRTWYLIPHSVIADMCRVGQQVYVFSDYLAPMPGQPDLRNHFPEARVWNRNVLRDPHIRVKMGAQIYRFLAVPVPEPSEEYDGARKICRAKNPDVRATFMVPASYQPRMHFFRLTQR
jgi:hypothetical protein